MDKLKFGSLFSGIGGMDLGLEQAGLRCVFQVEQDEDCLTALRYHWPDVPKFEDIRTFIGNEPIERPDVLAGGFPCQDLSVAGFNKGLSGERSKLWYEFFRLICVFRPRYVVIENVSALINRGLRTVLCNLAEIGYDAEWQVIKASDFALPHSRERLFVIAYPNSLIRSQCARLGIEQDRETEVFKRSRGKRSQVRVSTFDHLIGMDDGLSRKIYQQTVCGIGNAVAVPVAKWIGSLITSHNLEMA